MKITHTRTSEDDGEGTYTVEMDEYQMQALVRILKYQEPHYEGYTPPYTSRYAEHSALATFLESAKRLGIYA
jgi:hypothetical protein